MTVPTLVGRLLPRSGPYEAAQTLEALHGSSVEAIADVDFDLAMAHFHPSQGDTIPVTSQHLLQWREGLNAWARDEWGFPSPFGTQADRFAWDVALGSRLRHDLAGAPELLHPNVWCWIASALLPHLVVHRYGWPTSEGSGRWRRFGPTSNNALRLPVYRDAVYGAELTLRASQQELQSILNRPSYGNDPRVARIVLGTLLAAHDDRERSGYGVGEPGRAIDADLVLQELRVRNSLRPLCFLVDDDVESEVRDAIASLPELRGQAARLQEATGQ